MPDNASRGEGVGVTKKFAELGILRKTTAVMHNCNLTVCKLCIDTNYTLHKGVCQFYFDRQCCHLLALKL